MFLTQCTDPSAGIWDFTFETNISSSGGILGLLLWYNKESIVLISATDLLKIWASLLYIVDGEDLAGCAHNVIVNYHIYLLLNSQECLLITLAHH